jgi:ABC-type spermidine/putrescine transport system permease subunit II
VALPIARPGMAVAFILAVIFSWNNFVFGIVLAGRETPTLPVAVYNMISSRQRFPPSVDTPCITVNHGVRRNASITAAGLCPITRR